MSLVEWKKWHDLYKIKHCKQVGSISLSLLLALERYIKLSLIVPHYPLGFVLLLIAREHKAVVAQTNSYHCVCEWQQAGK